MTCIFSIDVEDWFHILDLPTTPALPMWDSLPSCVERDFHRLLEILAESEVRCTCFVLGWVAERFPHLVSAADRAGHEIASHGYSHQLVYSMSADEFREDVRRSQSILGDITGRRPIGYRAPGFSVTTQTPWYYDVIAEEGFMYSSSVFPANRGHGGIAGAKLDPYEVLTGKVWEFPISVIEGWGHRVCVFGGGYFRLFPLGIIRYATKSLLTQKRLVNFYLHPREINPSHPRLKMSRTRKFKTYVNLRTTSRKLKAVLAEFEFETFADQLEKIKLTST